jgi:rhodanese-related sulfurtransferase
MVRLTIIKLATVALALSATSKVHASDNKHGKKHEAKKEDASTNHAEVSLDELKKLIETKSAVLIDANSAKTYDKGHIPGAVSFTKNEKAFASLLPTDKNALLVAYCGGPMCSAWEDAAETAKKAGYTNIKHFKGGLKGWKSAGLSLEKPEAKK